MRAERNSIGTVINVGLLFIKLKFAKNHWAYINTEQMLLLPCDRQLAHLFVKKTFLHIF